MGSVISGLCLIWGGVKPGERCPSCLPLRWSCPPCGLWRGLGRDQGSRRSLDRQSLQMFLCPSEACLGMLLTPLGGGAVRSM